MKSEDQLKEELIRQELAKIAKHNPTAVPLYIIVNSLKPSECVEQPLTLCKKELPVKEFVENIRKKYTNFPFVYFFGKENRSSDMSGKNKQKKGSAQAKEERQKFIAIDQRLESKVIEEIHQKYKDPNGLLVVVVSQTELMKAKRKPIYQTIFYVLAIVFAVAFLVLTLSQQEVAVRRESELDFIV